MKKLKLFIILLLFLIPFKLNALEEKEIKYKFYTEVPYNIHYEKEENKCESLIDKNNFIYTDYIYSLDKPESKDGRIIEEEKVTLNLNKDYVDEIRIDHFSSDYKVLKIEEIEFFNENNELIEYSIVDYYFNSGNSNYINDNDINTYIKIDNASFLQVKFNEAYNLLKIKIKITYQNEGNPLYGLFYYGIISENFANAFDHTSTNNDINCDEDICESLIEINDDMRDTSSLEINTIVYKYKDTVYKCYDKKRIYVPGYFSELEGFIKDEEKYEVTIKEINDTKEEVLPVKEIIYKNTENDLYDNLIRLNSISDFKEKNIINNDTNDESKTNNTTCSKTDKNDEQKEEVSLLILIVGLICLVLSIILQIKNVINSRTKY